MKSIIFSRHPEEITIDNCNAVCIYHKAYKRCLPSIANCEYIEFGRVCDEYQSVNHFEGKDSVIFVGANKFFNPSNRFHPVFEVLQYGLPTNIRRYSVDIAPYVGPIWRLWTHFSFAGVPYGGYTYSYLLESHYNAFLDGLRDEDPMSLENIQRHSRGHIDIRYTRYFPEPKISIIAQSEWVHREYQALKEALFNRHDTIAPIIKGLSRFARECCAERRIPQEWRMFDSPDDIQIVRTDLKVDEYLTGELVKKINEANRVVEMLQP